MGLGTLSRHRDHVNAPTDDLDATDSLVDDLNYGIRASRALVSSARRKGGNPAASIILRALAQLADMVELRHRLEARRLAPTGTREHDSEEAQVELPARAGTADLIAAIEHIYGIRVRDTLTVIDGIGDSNSRPPV